jgi:hypothetical protein
MALTESQLDSVFEILELPRATSVDRPIGDMGLTAQTYAESNTDYQLQTKVEARLAALTSAQQTRMISYINQWESLDTTVASIDGSMGNMIGVNFDPDKERYKIQERVKRLCNVYAYLEEIQMEKNRNKGGNSFIPVLN